MNKLTLTVMMPFYDDTESRKRGLPVDNDRNWEETLWL